MDDQFAALHENPDMWVLAEKCNIFLTHDLYIKHSDLCNSPSESSVPQVVSCTLWRRWTLSCIMWSMWYLMRLTGEKVNGWKCIWRHCNVCVNIFMFLLYSGCLKWVLLNSFRRSSRGFRRQDRLYCSLLHYLNCWWSLPELVTFSLFHPLYCQFCCSDLRSDHLLGCAQGLGWLKVRVYFQGWRNQCSFVWM